MKKKNFFSGSVFQFYVPEIERYAFCKFCDFTHISSFHGLLAQVFYYFSKTENNSLINLKESDWLFGPRSMHKWPNLRKDTGWKSLGIISSAEDEIIPAFKGAQPFPNIVEVEEKIGPWYPIINFVAQDFCDYKAVHHLEHIILTTSIGIQKRTGMEFCRVNGLNVANYFDLTDEGNKKIYWQMINVPVYETIPKEIRGKALVSI